MRPQELACACDDAHWYVLAREVRKRPHGRREPTLGAQLTIGCTSCLSVWHVWERNLDHRRPVPDAPPGTQARMARAMRGW